MSRTAPGGQNLSTACHRDNGFPSAVVRVVSSRPRWGPLGCLDSIDVPVIVIEVSAM